MLYWFAVMWVALASSRGCGKVCSRSFKGNTGMRVGWARGGNAAGGHVASTDKLKDWIYYHIYRLHNIHQTC